jgi:hypothetical protein
MHVCYRYANGDVFEGFFSQGLRQGSGVLKYNANESRREGQWVNDTIHGFAFFHYSGPSSPTVERWDHGVKISGDSPQQQQQHQQQQMELGTKM